jgi:riboflavin synthase
MFTGLIEALGTVRTAKPSGVGVDLVISVPLAQDLKVGDSIAVNGACLTVVEQTSVEFRVQAGPETLARTNLGELTPNDAVNLERALCLGDRLGGHLVQGHVDGLGWLADRQRQEDWELVRFTCAPSLIRQMVAKGSVAVDGVSLTLVDVGTDGFSVALIPHTLAKTTLGSRRVGDAVNLETDMLAKYVEKQLLAAGLTLRALADRTDFGAARPPGPT